MRQSPAGWSLNSPDRTWSLPELDLEYLEIPDLEEEVRKSAYRQFLGSGPYAPSMCYRKSSSMGVRDIGCRRVGLPVFSHGLGNTVTGYRI